jgi:uncharacterized SAM-binding protein YcdF (DUF218 family)
MPFDLKTLCDEMNALAGWLALDEMDGRALEGVEAIVYMGNQVPATLAAACRMAQGLPGTRLALCGGVGHATGPMRERLMASEFGALAAEGTFREAQPEAEMAAEVARRSFAIKEDRLLLETRSSNCGENARCGIETLRETFGRSVRSVLIQDPTMQRRAVECWRYEAGKAGLAMPVVSHAVFVPAIEPGADGRPRMAAGPARASWSVERFLGLVLGEMERLNDDERGYGPRGRGFLGHVEIPAELIEKWRRLRTSPLAAMATR